jgi:hypothetical protein
MKKLILLTIFIVSVSAIYGQRSRSKSNRRGGGGSTVKWLSLAAKGGFGNSIFLNNEIKNNSDVSPELLTPSYFIGGRFGFTFGDFVGVSFEALSSTFGQKYSIRYNSNDQNKEFKMKSLDYLVLFRYTGETGFYAELGPKFSTIKSVVETNTLNNPASDVGNNFVTKFNSVVLGFGMMPVRTDRLTVSLGLRGNYSMNSLVVNENYFPLHEFGVNNSDNKLKPLAVQLVLEINYFFAFFGDASCGKGRIMFFQ